MAGAPRTAVFLHAHPDDEALLTGGTMARAAAAGHRVVLVTATGGEAGLTAGRPGRGVLAERRRGELARAAAALGVARLEQWDYPDSGVRPDAVPDGAFSTQPVEPVAERLAALLTEERAALLTTYDPAGGYGHPDHVQVHRVGVRAAELAGTPAVYEATVHRERLQRALRLIGPLPGLPPEFRADRFAHAFRPGAQITHRVDVRRHLPAKRAALRAHASQAVADGQARTLQVLLALPRPVAALVLGQEWYVRRGWTGRPGSDLFAELPGGRS